ncbi:MAG: four helix bundle protein [Candidatus Liptonbacteria bacterium]
MEIFGFRDWSVYKDAKDLFGLSIRISNRLPAEYRHSIVDQLIRASLSVALNIAEGSGRGTKREFNRFLDIAVGSLNETFAILDVLRDLKSIKDSDYQEAVNLSLSISKQLGGFKRSLRK